MTPTQKQIEQALQEEIERLKAEQGYDRTAAVTAALRSKCAELNEWFLIGKELGAGYPENTVSVMVQVRGLKEKLDILSRRLEAMEK